MNPVLLTISGVIPAGIHEKIARGEKPKADYIAMAEAFPADLIDYSIARKNVGWWGKFLQLIGGPNLVLAWACFVLRKEYRVIFTDGEQVGIPLAFLLKFFSGRKRPAHLMIAHILSIRKKEFFFDLLHLQSHIETFIVYATWQKKFIETRWKVPPERVMFTPFMVDTNFFTPDWVHSPEATASFQPPFQGKGYICSVGLERRDYPTLIDAVAGLDFHVVIAAGSPWSKRSDSTSGRKIPENVLVQRYSQHELRDIYASSQFLVMPLYPVQFQAGVTAILEAMAMERAVICTRTPGQTDIVVEGETGLYVPPEEPQALREAILYLENHPDHADQMGKNGRRRVLEGMSLDCYVQRLKTLVWKFIDQ
jgi:glycosyltransferase involved in cell wall biosynthesis